MEMQTFEVLSSNEMEQVDGGAIGLVGGIVIGFVADGIIIATTGKSAGEWVATGLEYTGQKVVDTY